MKKLKQTENFVVLGLFLGVLSAICALLLAFFSDLVQEPIAEAERRSINRALAQVLPPFDNHPRQDRVIIDGVTFMGAFKDGQLIAIAASEEQKGYAGPIQTLVGLELDGRIRAILVTKHSETPGLGSNVCERKFQKTIFNLFQKSPDGIAPNSFLDQFNGKSAVEGTSWKIQKDGGEIEYITGATISCRAITGLMDDITQCYRVNREEIIAELARMRGETQ